MNNYGESFELVEAVSKNGSIKVVGNTIIPDKGYELELEITVPPVEGRSKVFAEEFSLGLSNGLRLRVPCYVFYSRTNRERQADSETCTVCGPKIFDPKTGKVRYAYPKAKSGT